MVLGITGLAGSGKSSFAKSFGDYGALIIDADRVGHKILQLDDIKQSLVDSFGHDILVEDQINRSKLAKKAFQPNGIEVLNSICHPAIYREIERIIQSLPSGMTYVVLEAALLFEAGFNGLCNLTLCLEASLESRAQRVSQRGWSLEELKNRDEHQDVAQKRSRSDLCLNGDVAEGYLKPWTKKLDIVLRYAMAVGHPDLAAQLAKSWNYPLPLA